MGTLYENIKSLCDEAGVSGSKMCVDLGLSKSLMTKLKTEPSREISSDTALKIANYFGVPTDRVLYGKEDIKKEPTLQKEDELDEITKAFIEKIKLLDADTVAALDTLADTFLAKRNK